MTTPKRTPRVTVHKDAAAQTPSERLEQQDLASEDLVAADGKVIHVRQPDVLASYDLIEAVGPEVAANQTYMQMVNPLIYVASLNGEPLYAPTTLLEVKALIKQLGHAGMNALNAWYVTKVLGPTLDAIEKAKKEARVKN